MGALMSIVPMPSDLPRAAPSAGYVLVVDDSASIREQVCSELAAAGFETRTAVDLRSARAMLATTSPDAVVLDLMLPDGEGTELLNKGGPPVIMLTGSGHPELVAVALQAGAHDFVNKPFDASEVLARVRAAVRTKHQADALRSANTRLEAMARTDSLTGLVNRRYATEELDRLVASAARHDGELSVLMVDVDRFKGLNDDLGHETGDRVLHRMAHQLGVGLRITDVLARWGGEEFVALLAETGIDGAIGVARRMRERAAEPTPGIPSVTVSIGCATWRRGESADELLARADAALYEAKRAGRDRVVVDAAAPATP
jgi:two-component system cell cycle response regulator